MIFYLSVNINLLMFIKNISENHNLSSSFLINRSILYFHKSNLTMMMIKEHYSVKI